MEAELTFLNLSIQMPIHYRYIILGAFGWLTLVGTADANAIQPEQPKKQHEIADSLRHIGPALERANEPGRAAKACDPDKPDRNSDLCAQWKAADAAAVSAWWAWASGLLGIGSLVGVLIALGLAFHSNWIARDTAKRQLRAYVYIEPGGIEVPMNGLSRVPTNIINNGQTPAYDLELTGDFLIITGDPREFNPERDGRLGNDTAKTDAVLGPQTNRFSYAYLEAELCSPFMERIREKKAAIIHYGRLMYRDAFGEQRRTSFAFYHWGEELSDLESKRCRWGNDAT